MAHGVILGYFTYLLLNKNADPKKLEAKFPQLVAKYVVPEVQHDMGVSLAEAQKSVNTFRFSLQPLTDIHLYSNTKYELEPNGDIQYVYIFSALGCFHIVACLRELYQSFYCTCSKACKRSRYSKSNGLYKKAIDLPVSYRVVLFTFFAMLCAYVLIFLLLPYFNQSQIKISALIFFLAINQFL